MDEEAPDLPEEEPVEGPEPKSVGEAPPSWLTAPSPLEGPSEEPTPSPSSAVSTAGAARLITKLIVFLHAKAATTTHYEGWRLDPDEADMWEEVMQFLFKGIEVKNLGIYVVVAMLMVTETTKVSGWLKYRRWPPKGAGPAAPPPMKQPEVVLP